MRAPRLFVATLVALLNIGPLYAGSITLQLPTDNTHLFTGKSQLFYMGTGRSGANPWRGGTYGFVRNLKSTRAGTIYTKFHEGVDIAPLRRSSSGEPLDDVRSMAKGKVVHCNGVSSRSNYGKYVVVEHATGDGPFYSLYAHLKSISVSPGQRVAAGSKLGGLGYTGRGINKARAHVHVEMNLLLHSKFRTWHDKHHRTPNHNGIYNGINLTGMDIATILKKKRASLPRVVKGTTPYYKVIVPNTGTPDVLKRYKWLGKTGRGPSIEITFSAAGMPLKFSGHKEKVPYPTISWVRHFGGYHTDRTKGFLGGSGGRATLTKKGRQHVELVAGAF